MSTAARTISLKVIGEHGPSGDRAAEAGGTSHEFEGWLGLLAPHRRRRQQRVALRRAATLVALLAWLLAIPAAPAGAAGDLPLLTPSPKPSSRVILKAKLQGR